MIFKIFILIILVAFSVGLGWTMYKDKGSDILTRHVLAIFVCILDYNSFKLIGINTKVAIVISIAIIIAIYIIASFIYKVNNKKYKQNIYTKY